MGLFSRSLFLVGLAFLLATAGCDGNDDPEGKAGSGGTGGIGGSGGSGGDGGTGGTGGIEAPEEICDNGTDDDEDGAADCDDSDCADDPACLCGNGAIDEGEECDGTELGGKDCASEGFDGGVLSCSDACELDVSRCTRNEICDNETDDDGDGDADCADADCSTFEACRCGNGTLDVGEACDGTALGGKTCESLGYASGTLACTAACELDESGCRYPDEVCDNETDDDHDGDTDCDDEDCALAPVCLCGNGVLDDGEDCDGTELGEATCLTLDFEAGELACNADCTFDTSGCRLVEDCADGQDDDHDGDVDCEDTECQEASNCNVCGDNRADPAEVCDGTDLAGETCQTQGFAGGTLACVGCAFDTSDCHEAEACTGGVDEDRDGLVDCADPDCAAHANCVPGAFCHTAIEADGHDPGQMADAHSSFAGSCAGPGKDRVYVYTPGQPGEVGNLHIELVTSGNLAFYVRTACDDPASEVLCVDDVPDYSSSETADLTVQGGVPLYIFVDSPEAASAYNYQLRISFDVCGNGVVTGTEECDPPDGTTCNENCRFVEDECGDLADNDGDGLFDCADPTACAADPVCVPGTGAIGSPCVTHSDCAASAGSTPICFGEASAGYPSGMCSEVCDLDNPACPAGSACVDIGRTNGTGACFPTCTGTGAGDCATPGYVCAASGAATVCQPECTAHAQCGTTGHCDLALGLCSATEDCDNGLDDDRNGDADCDDAACAQHPVCLPPETNCGNFLDDDNDGAVDCRDETGCGATAACTPGTGAVGSACTAASDCASTADEDPACLTGAFAGGYCTELCDPGGTDCPAGTACVEPGIVLGQSLSTTVGVCMKTCTAADECGDGWTCATVETGVPQLCVPVEDCGNSIDDDFDGAMDCSDSECVGEPVCQTAGACGVVPTAGPVNTGTTVGAGDNWSDNNCYGNGPDTVYRYSPNQPGATGKLTIRVTSSFDAQIFVRSTCDDSASSLGCVDGVSAGQEEVGSIPWFAGDREIFIFIDGYSASDEGTYTLSLDYHVYACGNGAIDPGEGCDDGNTTAGDGCDASCQREGAPAYEVEPNDDFATANPWVPGFTGETWVDLYSWDWDEDYVWFDVPGPSSTVTVETFDGGTGDCANSYLDTYLTVYDPNGITLDENEDISYTNWCSSVTVTGLPAGRYYANVETGYWQEWASFEYELLVIIQ